MCVWDYDYDIDIFSPFAFIPCFIFYFLYAPFQSQMPQTTLRKKKIGVTEERENQCSILFQNTNPKERIKIRILVLGCCDERKGGGGKKVKLSFLKTEPYNRQTCPSINQLIRQSTHTRATQRMWLIFSLVNKLVDCHLYLFVHGRLSMNIHTHTHTHTQVLLR